MAYIVNQDLIDRVGNEAAVQLTSDSGSSVVAAVLDEVRLSTEGEVNGYLAKRFAVPLDLTAHPDAAATLKGVCLDIGVYRLMSRRPPVAEAYRQARDDAIEWLTKVANADIELPVEETPDATNANDPFGGWGSDEPRLSDLAGNL